MNLKEQILNIISNKRLTVDSEKFRAILNVELQNTICYRANIESVFAPMRNNWLVVIDFTAVIMLLRIPWKITAIDDTYRRSLKIKSCEINWPWRPFKLVKIMLSTYSNQSTFSEESPFVVYIKFKTFLYPLKDCTWCHLLPFIADKYSKCAPSVWIALFN